MAQCVSQTVQDLLYYTDQQGEVWDRMDTEWKRYTLGEFLRVAETWITLYNQERPAREARYPLSASICEAAGVGGSSFTRPLVRSL